MTIASDINRIKQGDLPKVTLVLGTEDYLNDKVSQAFIQGFFGDQVPDDFSFGRFDMENIPLGAAIEEATSLPFFGGDRLVFIEHPYFLTSQPNKVDLDHDTDALLAYLDQPAEFTRLVIFAPYDQLDKRRKVNKALLKEAWVVSTEEMDEKDSRRYLQDYLNGAGYQMTPDAFDRFLTLTDQNLSKMMNELDKLFIYKSDDKTIHKKDVEALVPRSLNQNIFALTDYLLKKDLQAALEVFRDLLLQKESPVAILATMLSQFRLLLQVKILRARGYQQADIQKSLGVHKYRVFLALKSEGQYHQADLVRAVQQLVEADYAIKTGQMDAETQLELWIISYCGKK